MTTYEGIQLLPLAVAAKRAGRAPNTLRINPTFPAKDPDVQVGRDGAYHPITVDDWQNSMYGRGIRTDLWEPLNGEDPVSEDYALNALRGAEKLPSVGSGDTRHMRFRTNSRRSIALPIAIDGEYHAAVATSADRKVKHGSLPEGYEVPGEYVPLIVAPWGKGHWVIRVVGYGVTQTADYADIEKAAARYIEALTDLPVHKSVTFPVSYDVEGGPELGKIRRTRKWLLYELQRLDEASADVARVLKRQGVHPNDIDAILGD